MLPNDLYIGWFYDASTGQYYLSLCKPKEGELSMYFRSKPFYLMFVPLANAEREVQKKCAEWGLDNVPFKTSALWKKLKQT